MENTPQEPQALIDMRTHLTVATLALAQLRRRHGDSNDVERLCSYATSAMQQLTEDITAVERILLQAEQREESRQAHLALRQSYADHPHHYPMPR